MAVLLLHPHVDVAYALVVTFKFSLDVTSEQVLLSMFKLILLELCRTLPAVTPLTLL